MRRAPQVLLAAVLLALTAALLGGCASTDAAADAGALDVVASVSFLSDIAQNVAGDRFMVHSLVPLETDPHSFDPTPSDLTDIARADLLIVNGAGLEGTLLDTMENVGGNATVVPAAAGLTSRMPQPGEPALEDGGADPHFWLDPTLAKAYVATIRDAFVTADPAGAAEYDANAAAYLRQLDELDSWIRGQIETIPVADRKLVMNHASHGYFADRYGLQIIGTVLPGANTGEAPTARQLSDLVGLIESSGARAIFVETGENPDLACQIAAESGATVVTGLLDHSLTAPDGPAPTYIDMMRYDTRLIVEALR